MIIFRITVFKRCNGRKIVSVIDRKEWAGENITRAGYSFESILTKDDLGMKDTN